jgi:hypothetical protein
MTAGAKSSITRWLALFMVLAFSGSLAGSAALAEGAAEATPSILRRPRRFDGRVTDA